MAKFYVSGQHYLLKKDLMSMAWGLGVIFLPLAVVILLVNILPPAATIVAALVLVLLTTTVLSSVVNSLKRRSGKYYKGRYGEKDVKKVLISLPDNFVVFEDVLLPGQRGNIDFVVLGPGGIFTLEVKSHGGAVDFDGRGLTINGRPSEKDFLRQAMGQALALKRYLNERLGGDRFITPVVVFSHEYASVRFGLETIRHVRVAQKNYLLNLLYSGSRAASPSRLPTVEAALSELYKSR